MNRKSCPQCQDPLTEGAHCNACNNDVHFHCGGIAEANYRLLGERKATWRCQKCKQSGIHLPVPPLSGNDRESEREPTPAMIFIEIKSLASKLTVLETLPEDVKGLKDELANLRSSVDTANSIINTFEARIKSLDDRLSQLENAKKDQANLILARLDKMEEEFKEREQWSRANNIEIKGIKEVKNENLYDIVRSLGDKIQYPIQKTYINFISRVPTRDPNNSKPIIVCFNNRYIKEDIIAAARAAQKESLLMPSTLGLQGKDRIYLNDHLTLDNKILLNKTRKLKQEMGFQYVWVKHCKIHLRKSDTSPVIHIKSEKDLIKLANK
ncbi:hypothetical protein O0L34_g14040 [Tuta absoluta]|nr:hypothetical protein O0L34_g14040 [Tuta absoluta]